ncbi:hypothetical protein EXIGLDRAFT_607869, partial [Exidia glandulosa HHB12029]
SETAAELAKGTVMSDNHYQLLLDYLNHRRSVWVHRGAPFRSFYDKVLPGHARHPTQISHDDRTYSCRSAHEGNSCILFDSPNGARYSGFVDAIWTMPLDGLERSFLLMRVHDALGPEDTAKSPFMLRPRLRCRLAPSTPSDRYEVIETHHIVSHLAMWKRPRGTYGIDIETIILCDALNRGRNG